MPCSWSLFIPPTHFHFPGTAWLFPATIMKRIVVYTSLCAMLCNASCQSKKEVKEEDSKYTVTNPVVMDTSFTKEYVSQIRSVRNIEIRAQEKGYLQNI